MTLTVKALWCWIIGASFFCQALLVQAQSTLLPFDNEYSARLYGFKITVTSKLSKTNNGNYVYSFIADSMVGNVTEKSEMVWDGDKATLLPQHYSYQRTGLGKNKDYSLQFDWKNSEIINLKNQNHLAIASGKTIQDNLSYQILLQQDLIQGKSDFSYAITNGKKIYDYRFEIVGQEILETPLGKVNTVKVKRSQTHDKRETYAWFAKDFHYLLVGLQQEENGSAYAIYISKAVVNGKAIEHF